MSRSIPSKHPAKHPAKLPTRFPGQFLVEGSIMSKVLLASLLLGTAALAGCEGHSRHHFEVGAESHNYKQRHPITIGEKEHTLDIPVGRSRAGVGHALPRASQQAVAGFAQGYARNPSSTMRVMMPTGSPNAHVASALGSDILEALSNGGVEPDRVEIMHYDASRHGATAPIRLSYHGIAADVHECGKWDADLTRQNDNRNYTNFGCATQRNLARIVANPADLLAPRGTAPIDGENRANKIRQYRQTGNGQIAVAAD